MILAVTEKAYHHGNLRPALLNAAKRLLRTEGVAGLSLRSVARAAGVSHAAPYRHFADKQALLAGLAETGFARLRDGMREAAARYPNDPRRQLVEAAAVYVRLATSDPELTHLMFGGALPQDAYDESQRQTGLEAFQAFVAIIEQGVHDGAFVQRPVLELAGTAWSLVHGLAMLLSTGVLGRAGAPPKVKPETLARRMAEQLIAGIEAR
jgi:AcrR family transcriptional regulator